MSILSRFVCQKKEKLLNFFSFRGERTSFHKKRLKKFVPEIYKRMQHFQSYFYSSLKSFGMDSSLLVSQVYMAGKVKKVAEVSFRNWKRWQKTTFSTMVPILLTSHPVSSSVSFTISDGFSLSCFDLGLLKKYHLMPMDHFVKKS